MPSSWRDRVALAALPLLLAAVALAHPAAAAAQPVTNACKSNATGNWSDIEWTISGTPSPASITVAAGATVTLSDATITGNVPATILIAGYNLGLLTTGSNNIPTKVYVARQATNVDVGGGAGGTKVQVDLIEFTATTTITDPNGTPGNGDEQATPISISQPLPDMTVTPVGGDVQFSQAGTGSLPTIPAGTAGPAAVNPLGSIYSISSVANGLIRANFDCQPGTSAADQLSFSAASSWASFATASVTGGTPPSSTTTTTTTTTTSTTVAPTTTTQATTTTAAGATTTTTAKSGTGTVAAASSGPVSGSATYATSCKNTATPDVSTIEFTVAGTVPGGVKAGDKVTLTKHNWKVAVPGSVMDTGIGLGLIAAGQTVPGTVKGTIIASNTKEAKLDVPAVNTQFGPVTLGSDGKAQAAQSSFAMGDLTFTASGAPVALSLGAAVVDVTVGPIKVTFTCDPGAKPAAFVTTSGSGGGAQVLGASLARTGTSTFRSLSAAALLLDIGYLALSATKPPRRRVRAAISCRRERARARRGAEG